MSTTIKIYQDGKLMKEFNNLEKTDVAFGWLLMHQGQSVDYALRHGGWKVEEINEQTKEVDLWQPRPKLKWASTNDSIYGYFE